MRKKKGYRIAACFLAALLLAGCAKERPQEAAGDAAVTGQGTKDIETPAGTEQPQEQQEPQGETKKLMLPYDPSAVINPYWCENNCNRVLSGLLYEGLFTLTPDFAAEPALCESFATEDSMEWDFTIRPDVKFSNGKTVTARDVVYSYSQAGYTGSVYEQRLDDVQSIVELDDMTVRITLYHPNALLPRLLDIPVVPDGEGGENVPAGTGPYTLKEGTSPIMQANAYWRKGESTEDIGLVVTSSDEQQLFDFQTGTTNLVMYDRTRTGSIGYRDKCESYSVGTTVMQYLGFNTDSFFTAEAETRRAFSLAVEREKVATGAYGAAATGAYVPISPKDAVYEDIILPECRYGADAVHEALLDCGFTETADGTGLQKYGTRLTLRFIVNRENTHKSAAAQMIAETLRAAGVDVELRVLEWSYFCQELANRNFDIYYGEIKLMNDFDLTSLLKSYEELNYGNYANSTCDAHLKAYRSGEEDAQALCDFLLESCPITTVLFKNDMMLTSRGLVTGASPSAGNCFYGFENWNIR